jgi:hypothetical protein
MLYLLCEGETPEHIKKEVQDGYCEVGTLR